MYGHMHLTKGVFCILPIYIVPPGTKHSLWRGADVYARALDHPIKSDTVAVAVLPGA